MAVVPSCDVLSSIYTSDLLKHGVRFQALTEAFVAAFGCKPDFIARAPGRVNIIGEHIDYCGFPVFPMAIVPDFLIAVRATGDCHIQLVNRDARYPACSFDCSPGSTVTIDSTTHNWANYFKCGYKGAIDALGTTNPSGMRCMVDGSVPSSAGLSGSSALV
ncbi:galactokinase, partial [Coemansia biformis]